jgi:uncharacterized protein (DUF169 family)
MVDDISKARKRRTEIRAPYLTPDEAFIESYKSKWRDRWARHCAKTGKSMSFEEWFFATDEDGMCPFDVALIRSAQWRKS